MKIEDAVKAFGSQRKLAEKLGIRQSAVANWIYRGRTILPELQARRLHELTRGKMRFNPEDYR